MPGFCALTPTESATAGDYTIYDGADSKSLVKMIIKDMNLDEKLYKPVAVLSSISMAKNAIISPEAYIADRDIMEADRRARRSETAAIYRHYRDRCHVNNAMDFDDLLYNTNVLLRDNPDILRHYQEYFRYILVDEYQDTNFAQHLIVSQLCSATENLCVVGDDARAYTPSRCQHTQHSEPQASLSASEHIQTRTELPLRPGILSTPPTR